MCWNVINYHWSQIKWLEGIIFMPILFILYLIKLHYFIMQYIYNLLVQLIPQHHSSDIIDNFNIIILRQYDLLRCSRNNFKIIWLNVRMGRKSCLHLWFSGFEHISKKTLNKSETGRIISNQKYSLLCSSIRELMDM